MNTTLIIIIISIIAIIIVVIIIFITYQVKVEMALVNGDDWSPLGPQTCAVNRACLGRERSAC